MRFYSCSRCGGIHPEGYICKVGPKRRREYKPTEERKLRNLGAWHKKSEEVRDKAHNLCEVCRDEGRYVYKDIEVHHITKLRDNPEGLLDNCNLICLCQKHHKQADRGQISAEYLRELARRREEESA